MRGEEGSTSGTTSLRLPERDLYWYTKKETTKGTKFTRKDAGMRNRLGVVEVDNFVKTEKGSGKSFTKEVFLRKDQYIYVWRNVS